MRAHCFSRTVAIMLRDRIDDSLVLRQRQLFCTRGKVPIYLETAELPGTADELAANSRAGVAHCMPADPDQPAYSVP